jgi:2',3'-cyclic-nucleotide 2'-phosphodiesterase (5'-nucleotidase family)
VRGFRGELLPVRKGAAEPDPKVSRLVRKQNDQFAKGLDRRIGTLETDWRLNYGRPSNLAQWAADAMLLGVRRHISDQIHLAVINEGNLRKELSRGPILERDIWEICPFENPVVVFQVTAEELGQSVHFLSERPAEFMTWAGLKVKFENGHITAFSVGGIPVRPQEQFTVAASGYVWQHLDSYLGLSQSDRPNFYLPGITQRDLLIEAVVSDKVISTPLDDRWDVR